MNIDNNLAQMRKGVLELCILNIIATDADDECYASEILARLKNTELIVVEGTLYPILTRLKNDGFLSYQWVESTGGPPRKYYKLTKLGEKFHEQLAEVWSGLIKSVEQTTKKERRK